MCTTIDLGRFEVRILCKEARKEKANPKLAEERFRQSVNKTVDKVMDRRKERELNSGAEGLNAPDRNTLETSKEYKRLLPDGIAPKFPLRCK